MNSSKLKRKLMLRRMGVNPYTLTIGTKTPWWIRLLVVFIGLTFAAATGVWLYEQGASFAGFNKDGMQKEMERLRAENKNLQEERDRLTRSSISAESGLLIEKATAKQIASQSKSLEAENAKLKEDLRFFESLLPATGATDAISVRNLRGQLDLANNRLIVRLLVMQGGKHVNNFVGTLQINATGTVDGKPIVWNYPTPGVVIDDSGKLNFSRYQRVELSLPLVAGLLKNAVLKSVQVRVISGGVIKAQALGSVSQNVQTMESLPQ
jgi:hypothetical protein